MLLFIRHLHQYSHVGKIVIHLVSRWEVPGVKFIRDHDDFFWSQVQWKMKIYLIILSMMFEKQL